MKSSLSTTILSRLYLILGLVMLVYVAVHFFLWIVLTVAGVLCIKEGLRLQGWSFSRMMMRYMSGGRF